MLTIGDSPTLVLRRLGAQPLSYEDVNVRQGITVRQWQIEGILTQQEWTTLLQIHANWLAIRKTEDDALLTNSVGTTIPLSGTWWGQSWVNVPTWFASSPSGRRSGRFMRASFVLVDAVQALEALRRENELTRERAEADIPSYGTLVVGPVTLTLWQEPEARESGPSVEVAATGVDFVTGPLRNTKIREVLGYGPNPGSADYYSILAWFDAQVGVVPPVGQWYPVRVGRPEVQMIDEGGTRTPRYMIPVTLRLIQ